MPFNKDKKICSKCKQEKDTSFYYKRASNGDGLSNTCKECDRMASDKRVNSARAYLLDYLKSHPCVDCGESDPLVLQFDHIYDKRGNVSRLLSNKNNIASIKKEIKKCVVRCANCHMRKTAKEQNWYKLDV